MIKFIQSDVYGPASNLNFVQSSDISAKILLNYFNTVWDEIKSTVFDFWWIKLTSNCSLATLVKPTSTDTDTWNEINQVAPRFLTKYHRVSRLWMNVSHFLCESNFKIELAKVKFHKLKFQLLSTGNPRVSWDQRSSENFKLSCDKNFNKQIFTTAQIF